MLIFQAGWWKPGFDILNSLLLHIFENFSNSKKMKRLNLINKLVFSNLNFQYLWNSSVLAHLILVQTLFFLFPFQEISRSIQREGCNCTIHVEPHIITLSHFITEIILNMDPTHKFYSNGKSAYYVKSRANWCEFQLLSFHIISLLKILPLKHQAHSKLFWKGSCTQSLSILNMHKKHANVTVGIKSQL